MELDAERARLNEAHENTQPWYRWKPYLAERQWGTVREDYSPAGTAWAAWRVYKIEKRTTGKADATSWSAYFTSYC